MIIPFNTCELCQGTGKLLAASKSSSTEVAYLFKCSCARGDMIRKRFPRWGSDAAKRYRIIDRKSGERQHATAILHPRRISR